MIILLLMYTVVRVSELSSISIKNIGFLTSHLKIHGKGRKIRQVSPKNEVVEAIKEYLVEHNDSQFSDLEYLILG